MTQLYRATLGTPHRRTIYSASLEAHIDRLHSQLLGYDLFPVNVEDLSMYKGLNCKIAKVCYLFPLSPFGCPARNSLGGDLFSFPE